MTARFGLPLAAGLGVVLSGCVSFGEPPPELLTALAATAASSEDDLRLVGRVHVESEEFGGHYDAVLIVGRGSARRVRMQVFGDLGTKVLDLAASSERVVARRPRGEADTEVLLTADEYVPYDPLVLLGLTLLETFTPLAPERVLGARPDEAGWELSLLPVYPRMETTARVDASGELRMLRFRLRRAKWRQKPVGDGGSFQIEGGGLAFDLMVTESEKVDRLPDQLFELRR